MRRAWTWVLAAGMTLVPVTARAQVDYGGALRLGAAGPGGVPLGWGGGPGGTVFLDSVEFRSAPYSGRVERTPASEGEFSSLTLRVPVAFAGDTLELTGWLRTKDVTGWAGLWLREDGPAGVVQFDNMQQRAIRGTTDWTRYTIRLPLDRNERAIYLGALLAGQGTIWLDDVELRVDGRPATEAPLRPRVAAESDHEFDRGSGIAEQPLSASQVANLVLAGRVWGFARYHHPRLVRGDVNPDYELFRVLPAVLRAGSRGEAQRALAGWLEKLGEPPACAPCAVPPEHPQLAAGIAWIHDRGALGPELGARLEAIYRNRFVGTEQYYARQAAEGARNPDFGNEPAYAQPGVPDAGYRLLALYRLWNIVEYWYPYRDVVGEDWSGVLREFVPRLMAAHDSVGYRLALMQLIARVHDTHANLWSSLDVRPPAGPAQLPVVVRFVEGRTVVAGVPGDSVGAAGGLERGDVIESLDGAAVDSLVHAWAPYYAASNEPTRLRDMARSLTRGPAGPVRVVVRRGERTLALTPTRVRLPQGQMAGATHDLPGPAFRMLDDEVAYLKLSAVATDSIPRWLTQASGAKVLVVDIRNYPSQFVVFTLGGHLAAQRTPFARFTVGQPANPGAFAWADTVALQPLAPHFGGKVVILVDETSQSQAEYTTMAFRAAPGALVVGSTTAGADGNVSAIPLPRGLRGMISGIGVFYPDGRPTQRIGIVPDLEVKPTIAGIRAGRDEVLEAAVSRALGRDFRVAGRP